MALYKLRITLNKKIIKGNEKLTLSSTEEYRVPQRKTSVPLCVPMAIGTQDLLCVSSYKHID
jgi:hypothetical protein